IPSLGCSSQEAPAGPCARWVPQNSPVLSPVMAEELSELLREFDEVMEDFERGPGCQYQQHLEELKRKVGQSVYDSGIDELESASTSPGSSLNSSEEHLNTPADTYPTKAKLGDTQELEEFIADLDKALE
ncbi:RGCC protein, partial [Zosterops hypoxanthus]|nr:RGCC protein [Zosterops hypoxanthus]